MSVNSTLVRYCLAGCSGLALGLCFVFPGLFALAWVALVPLLAAIANVSVARAYALGVLQGVVLFAIGSYWVADFIQTLREYGPVGGWSLAFVYWLFCAQATGIVAALLAWSARHNMPFLLTLPIIAATVFHFFPLVFPLDLAVTQSGFYLALQGLDVFGAAGLAFVVLLGNALVYHVVYPARSRLHKAAVGCSVFVIAGWFGYGLWAFDHWHKQVIAWPTTAVGLVQANSPASIAEPPPEPGYSYAYPPEMALYEQLSEAGAEWVIWPETRYKGYFDLPHVQAAFAEQVARRRTALQLQDLHTLANGTTSNSAVLLAPGASPQQYRKMELIPFGERLPVPIGLPLASRLSDAFFGEFYSPLTPGIDPTTFAMAQLLWTPLICYEVVFAGSVAARNPAHFITVQSNDAWFGQSYQPLAHLAVSVLRSVETRTPLLHALNNGPSALVAPTGEILFEAPRDADGGFLLQVPLPKKPAATFYQRHPNLVPYTLLLLTLVLVSTLAFRRQ